MDIPNRDKITITNLVSAPRERCWEYWTDPRHIKRWNQAAANWHTPHAESDLRKDGNFLYRMEATDGSAGFDFKGVFDEVNPPEHLQYTLEDGRQVSVNFEALGDETRIIETFEAESIHPLTLQRQGWQAILDTYKKYVESESEEH